MLGRWFAFPFMAIDDVCLYRVSEEGVVIVCAGCVVGGGALCAAAGAGTYYLLVRKGW